MSGGSKPLASLPAGQANASRAIPTEVKDPDLVAERRAQIVTAAVKLFIDKGFHKTTTREIAKAAGFAIGTLYEYVQSKEDVLYLVCESIHRQMEKRLLGRLSWDGGGAQALAAAIEAYVQLCDEMSDAILLVYQEAASLPGESKRFVLANEERITAIFEELLLRGQRDYSLRPLDRAERKLMAHNIVVLGHMWTFRRWSLGKSFSLGQYLRLQKDLLMSQLAGR